ncbi:MAG: NAD(P)/FAD-dependent oxidoreductase [Myxococcales bacterium]|nr:NAD(P)/FAD-dependent oxidoreductase [Myxococcales bacterium]
MASPSTKTDDVPHVVIIGGGFGGLATARALSGAHTRLTLVDRSNHHLFQPLLYQVATAGLSPADIAYPIRTVLRHQDNARVLLAEVTGIDLAAKHCVLDDGSHLPFDYLVVAAGARTNYFDKEAEWKAHALGLKDLDEALAIRRRVLLAFEAAEREKDSVARQRLLTFVIIGGGPTGVEVAGALSDLARTVLADDFRTIDPSIARIVIVERGDRLLAGGFHPKLSKKALRQLVELGVEVRLSTTVERVDPRGVSVNGGERIDAATVLWTAGIKARGVARTLGSELDRTGRVIVGPDCRIPGQTHAFAIGDIAHMVQAGDTEPLPGLAPVALQQGRYVGRLIAEAAQNPKPFHYVDKGVMATIGRSRAVAQAMSGSLKLSGFVAWCAWLFIHIWFLIGFRNRVSVLANWLWNYVTYRRGARLITGERSWDLLPVIAGHPPTPEPEASPAVEHAPAAES